MLSPRLWITIVTAALANAVSLALAAWVLPGFELTVAWWAAAVVLFTILSVVLRTVAQRLSSRWLRVSAITGGLALTAIALALTNVIVPDSGFRIHGWGTWVLVTLLVWAASVAFGEVDQQAPEKTPGVSPTTRAAREGDRRAS